jgi:hypothetical protein
LGTLAVLVRPEFGATRTLIVPVRRSPTGDILGAVRTMPLLTRRGPRIGTLSIPIRQWLVVALGYRGPRHESTEQRDESETHH